MWTPYMQVGIGVNFLLLSMTLLSKPYFPGKWCLGVEPGLWATCLKQDFIRQPVKTKLCHLFSREIYLLSSPQAPKAKEAQLISTCHQEAKPSIQSFAESDQQADKKKMLLRSQILTTQSCFNGLGKHWKTKQHRLIAVVQLLPTSHPCKSFGKGSSKVTVIQPTNAIWFQMWGKKRNQSDWLGAL